MITIGDVINHLKNPNMKTYEQNVDKLEFGQSYDIVNVLIVTFNASYDIIRKANKLKANIIISHEGIFYSHHSIGSPLSDSLIYKEKKRYIQKEKIAIYRFHNTIHSYKPDLITLGLIKALDWYDFIERQTSIYTIVQIEPKTLCEIAQHIKLQLQIPFIRYTGNLNMYCKRIAVLVGCRGQSINTIPLFEDEAVDLVIMGEGPEWETPEYVLDANSQKKCKALITIGHLESEEPGMKLFSKKLQEIFPSIQVHYLPHEKPFNVL